MGTIQASGVRARPGRVRWAMVAAALVAGVASVLAVTPPVGAAEPTDVSPFRSIDLFVDQQYRDFHGRAATGAELNAARPGLAAGTSTRAAAVDAIAHATGSADRTCNVTRLYTAYFLRNPDIGGLDYWVGRARAGTTLIRISNGFAGSSEFVRRYGQLSSAGFVDLAFTNIFERPADPGGRAYWIGKLNRGTSRGQVMANLSQSSEYQRKQAVTCEVVRAHAGLVRRIPTGSAFTDAVAVVVAEGFIGLAEDLLASAAWRARFPVPGSVDGLTAFPDDGQVVLRWTAPTTGGEPLTGYVIRTYRAGVPQPERFAGVGTAATITGLSNGTSYRFEVAARNRWAEGPAASAGPVLVNPEARWTSYQGNAAHTGYQPVGSLPATPAKAWALDLGGPVEQVLVADGLVYALVAGSSPTASNGARVYARKVADGSAAWGPVAISGTYWGGYLGYEDQRLFLGNDDGLIRAVDSRTGSLLWSAKVGGFQWDTQGVTVYGGSIYTWAEQGLVAVDTSNGKVRWTRPTMNNSGTPGVDATGVYVTQVCGFRYRFTHAGAPVWALRDGQCTGGGAGVAVPSGGKVWMDGHHSPVVVQASNGALYDSPAYVGTPAVAGNRVVYNNGGTFQGVTWADGQVRWSQAGEEGMTGSPVINGTTTYGGDEGGNVYAFDLTTGTQTWTRDVTEDAASAISPWEAEVGDLAIGGGLLLVPVGEGLVAYR